MSFRGRPSRNKRERVFSDLRNVLDRVEEKDFDKRSSRILLFHFKKRNRIKRLEDLL